MQKINCSCSSQLPSRHLLWIRCFKLEYKKYWKYQGWWHTRIVKQITIALLTKKIGLTHWNQQKMCNSSWSNLFKLLPFKSKWKLTSFIQRVVFNLWCIRALYKKEKILGTYFMIFRLYTRWTEKKINLIIFLSKHNNTFILEKNRVYYFILFNSIITIRSDDTLKTTSESLAVFDNVVPAHDHPFPVDGCSEVSNVWVANIARPGLNMRPEDAVQWIGVWREWRPHVFDQKEKFCCCRKFALDWMCVLGHHPVEAQQWQVICRRFIDPENQLVSQLGLVVPCSQSIPWREPDQRHHCTIGCNKTERHDGGWMFNFWQSAGTLVLFLKR